MTECDLLIRGGELIDPAQGLLGPHDIAVQGNRIAAVMPRIDHLTARHTIDARDLVVTPGLIDFHVHVYPHSPFGLAPDPLCSAGGVTTMLDAGTAGSLNFDQFREETIDRARTRIRALVHLSAIGLVSANLGELRERRYADPDGVIRTLQKHSDVAVGVKIRATDRLIGKGKQAWDNLRDAIRAARESDTWLMVHIGDCPMSIPELVEQLAPGDCITHCFRTSRTEILDDAQQLHEAVQAAAERGVLFDVGHGAGSFDWRVAEAALEQGFEPTFISTDLHTFNINGPVYDLPTTMSKFLLLGVPLPQIVEMTTMRPAEKLELGEQIGSLQVGSIADIAILERRTGQFIFEDSQGVQRVGKQRLNAAITIRDGQIVPGGGSFLSRQLAEPWSSE